MTDEEHASRLKEVVQFEEDLKALFANYKARIVSRDSYVQDDYAGIERYLELNGQCLYTDTVDEIFERVISALPASEG